MTNVAEQTPEAQASTLPGGVGVADAASETTDNGDKAGVSSDRAATPAKKPTVAKKGAPTAPQKAPPAAASTSATPGAWRSKTRDKCEAEAITAVRANKFMQLSELLRDDNGDDDEKSARMLADLRGELGAGRIYAVPLNAEKIMLIGLGEVGDELIAITPTFEAWREEFNLHSRISQMQGGADVTFDREQARRFFMTIAGARAGSSIS